MFLSMFLWTGTWFVNARKRYSLIVITVVSRNHVYRNVYIHIHSDHLVCHSSHGTFMLEEYCILVFRVTESIQVTWLCTYKSRDMTEYSHVTWLCTHMSRDRVHTSHVTWMSAYTLRDWVRTCHVTVYSHVTWPSTHKPRDVIEYAHITWLCTYMSHAWIHTLHVWTRLNSTKSSSVISQNQTHTYCVNTSHLICE